MEKGKKIFYILTTIVEVLLLIGAYMVNYFIKTRMGMMRHVVHKNYVWESTYPIETIKYVSITALVILMAIVLILYMKRKSNLKKIVNTMVITMVVVVLSFTVFLLIFSAEKIRAFYYISAIFSLLTLIQIIKTFIGVILYKN